MDIASTSTDTTPRAIRKPTSSRAPSSLVRPSFIIPAFYLLRADRKHDVVVDYLTTHAYLETAKSLVDIRPHSDEDGMDVEMTDEAGSSLDVDTLSGIEKRRSKFFCPTDDDVNRNIQLMEGIINHILNGAIGRAIDELQSHYPAVLDSSNDNGESARTNLPSRSNGTANGATNGNGNGASNGNGHSENSTTPAPARIYDPPAPQPNSKPSFPLSTSPSQITLNLHIQQFIESFRSLPQPVSPSSSISTSMSMSMSMSMSQSTGGLQHALTAASGLHAEAALLEPSIRAVYVREITEAGALFAYTDPDNSPVGGFLQQERRIALAEQINRAILSKSPLNDLNRFSSPHWPIPTTSYLLFTPSF
jgi:hypothetical protein